MKLEFRRNNPLPLTVKNPSISNWDDYEGENASQLICLTTFMGTFNNSASIGFGLETIQATV